MTEPESWLAVYQVVDLKRHLVVSVDRLAATSACAGGARRSRGRYYTDRSPCGMSRGGLWGLVGSLVSLLGLFFPLGHNYPVSGALGWRFFGTQFGAVRINPGWVGSFSNFPLLRVFILLEYSERAHFGLRVFYSAFLFS